MQNKIEHSLKYRSDIDGLRAVAIIPVVAYHMFPDALPGGFVGVDIFFVISGFLISSIVFRQSQTGMYSHVNFYVRRIKRIFPALGVVLAFSLSMGLAFQFRDELQQLGKHVFTGSFFISNFALSNEGGYFDAAAESKPLLHLWSLSIEEQFYLFWPLLVAYFWRKNLNVLYLLIFLTCISFISNIILIDISQSRTFYWPITRFWELLLGSLLAYAGLSPGARPQQSQHETSVDKGAPADLLTTNTANIISISGFALILFSVTTLDNNNFPGWWALLPTIGTVALIMAGQNAIINRTILSNRVAIFFGLISYPLYLWHWPLLVFSRQISTDELTGVTTTVIVGLAILLSYFTYRFVELPIRTNRSMKMAPVFLTCAISVIGILGIAARMDLLPYRLNEETHPHVKAINDWHYPIGTRDNYKKSGNFNTLVIGGGEEKVLLIGDSHIEQYWPRIERYSESGAPNFPETTFLTHGGCPPLPLVNRIEPGYHCGDFFKFAASLALSGNYRKVVIGGFWEGYFGLEYDNNGSPIISLHNGTDKKPINIDSPQADRVFREFATFLKQLSSLNAHVYLIMPNPSSPDFDPKALINRFHGSTKRHAIYVENFKAALDPVTSRLIKVARESGASVISPLDDLCDMTVCASTTADGMPIYMDRNHLNASFTRNNAQFLDRIFETGTSAKPHESPEESDRRQAGNLRQIESPVRSSESRLVDTLKSSAPAAATAHTAPGSPAGSVMAR